MVYLTDVKKYANEFGIDKKSEKKLYNTTKNINKFLKAQEQGLDMSEDLEFDGGAYDDRDEDEKEL